MPDCFVRSAKDAIPIHGCGPQNLTAFLKRRSTADSAWLTQSGFKGGSGELCLLPGRDGQLSSVIVGFGADINRPECWAFALCAEKIPDGFYALGDVPEKLDTTQAMLAWALGLYRFTRYKKSAAATPRLVIPPRADAAEARRLAEGVTLARDLINSPALDLGPQELAQAARKLASRHKAQIKVITGAALLKQNFPLIHWVGQAATRKPCLIDLRWGRKTASKVTLVGKGVCFDTGGLDLKPSSAMLTMKKDMSGAATMLALAHMIMDAKLNLRLRLLIPAVENSISDRAIRPGDVLPSRKGLSIEIGNTDAEGRLILADALYEADREKPDLLIDAATLTGAARMATGMEIPPFFCDDEKLAADLTNLSLACDDPLWRLPLWRGYENSLSSDIADLTNNPTYTLAGAITAGLFLNRFVEHSKSWIHLDIPGWIDRPRPGRRKGGEANAARALYALLKQRYA